MLARKFRLTSFPRDTRAVFHKTPFFTIKIKRNTLSYSRLGFIVSKKVDKRATMRNSLKRTFRARLEEAKIHESPGRDILVIFSSQIKDHIEEAATAVLAYLQK
jgi:ribonuclease P protein component